MPSTHLTPQDLSFDSFLFPFVSTQLVHPIFNLDPVSLLTPIKLGSVTRPDKQSIISNVLAFPANGINTLEIVFTCDKILWYWVFTGIGTKKYEVKGFNLFTITPKGQISLMYIEFNSIAWGADTGFTIFTRNGTLL